MIGAGVSVYHLLVENGVVNEAQSCQISAPGGCATKWINEFGYVTIPTLALTGFALVFAISTARCVRLENYSELDMSGKASKRRRREAAQVRSASQCRPAGIAEGAASP